MEKLGIWVPPNNRPYLTLIKAMSPGMVCDMGVKNMDSGLHYLQAGGDL